MPDVTRPGAESIGAPPVLRVLLGMQLGRMREASCRSAQAAAKAIRGSESKISRIELLQHARFRRRGSA